MNGDDYDVLHVDDDSMITSMVSDYLESKYDMEIDELNNPEEALAEIEKNSYDVVVSDYDMPQMNGLELLGEVREEYPDMPFILFTGKGSEEVASDAISEGVTDYLQKKTGTVQYDLLMNKIVEAGELNKKEKRLNRQLERLDEFAGMVSHDLRNPLNVAIGRADSLEEQDELLNRSLDRMEEIIQDSLDYARGGQRPDQTELVDISELAKECWENMKTYDAKLGVYDSEEIDADESRLSTMFENIYRNALEHGGEDVKVQLGPIEPMHTGTRAESDSIAGFYIQDDGPGIPKDIRDRVLESGYSTKKGGTGFGLSIVDQVVQAHDWDLSIEDSGVGGTRLEFYLE